MFASAHFVYAHSKAGQVAAAKIAAAQTIIQILTTECARYFLQQKQFFQSCIRRCQKTDIFCGNLFQPSGAIIQNPRPRHIHHSAGTNGATHRHFAAVIGVKRQIRKAVAIGYPAFVNFGILARHNSFYLRVFALPKNITAPRIVCGNAGFLLQFPRPGGKAKGFGSQRADRTNINHIAGKFR